MYICSHPNEWFWELQRVNIAHSWSRAHIGSPEDKNSWAGYFPIYPPQDILVPKPSKYPTIIVLSLGSCTTRWCAKYHKTTTAWWSGTTSETVPTRTVTSSKVVLDLRSQIQSSAWSIFYRYEILCSVIDSPTKISRTCEFTQLL